METKIITAGKILKYAYEVVFVGLFALFFKIIFLKGEAKVTDVLALATFAAISYVARDFLTSFALQILAHGLLTAAAVFLISEKEMKFILITYIFFYLFPDSVAYIRRNLNIAPVSDAPWPTILISLIIYIYGVGAGSPLLKTCAFFGTLIMLFIYLLQVYVDGLKNYVTQCKDVADLPLKKIISVNTRFVVAFAACLFILMLLGRIYDFTALYNAIFAAVSFIAKWIAVLIGLFFAFISNLFTTSTTSTETDSTGTSSIAGNYMNDSTYHAMQIFVGVLFVALIFMIFYKLIKKILVALFKIRIYDGDVVTRTDETSTYRAVLSDVSPRSKTAKTREDKLRRIYKKTVLLHKDELYSLNDRQTCGDIKEALTDEAPHPFAHMTRIYQEVRYGDVPADAANIKEMKQLSKQYKKRKKA